MASVTGSVSILTEAVHSSVDLVASHWLYHEMPPRAIRAALREARRVLRPGGALMAYDMYLVPGGAVGRWLHAG